MMSDEAMTPDVVELTQQRLSRNSKDRLGFEWE
jgi:hypothetical protein